MKSILENKRGKTSPVLIIGVVALVLLAVFIGYGQYAQNISSDGKIPATGCQIAPSVNLLASDTLVKGTTPTVSANYSIYDGSYVGSIPSSPAQGKSLDVLATASNYLNARASDDSLGCSTNDLKLAFTPYQAPTYKIYDDAYTQLTDGGGASNQSSSANTIVDQIKISGTPDKSTGDMLIVVEFSNKTQVTAGGINLAGATKVANPTWYTPAGTGSAVASFKIPAIVDGGSKTFDLSLSPESGQTIGAVESTVYTTLYTLNPVILDTNTGTFQTENTWQDSLGADNTIANIDYDYLIN